MSQDQLASLLHTHRSYISRVERAHLLPPVSMLARVGIILEVDKVILNVRRRNNQDPEITPNDSSP